MAGDLADDLIRWIVGCLPHALFGACFPGWNEGSFGGSVMRVSVTLALLCFFHWCICYGSPHDWINQDKGPKYEYAGPPEYLLEAFGVAAYSEDLKNHPEEYRIFYSPPFSSPILITVRVKEDASSSASLARVSGEGGYPDELGQVDYSVRFEWGTEKTQKLLDALRKDEVYEPLKGLTEIQVLFLESMDGNGVIIERVREGEHSICRVSSPKYLVQAIGGLIEDQGLTVYETVDLVPFVEAFDLVSEAVGVTFGVYGEVTIEVM